MKPQGILTRILIPIVAFMIILAVFAALRSRTIISAVMQDYHSAIVSQEREEILNIMKEDIPEAEVLPVLRRHFATEKFRYRVMKGEKVLITCCDFPVSFSPAGDGFLSAREGDAVYYGSRIAIDKYGLVIDVLREYPKMTAFRQQLNSTVTVFVLSVFLMILYILIILRRNLIAPIRTIMERIQQGEHAPVTSVRELDELCEEMNQAFATAEVKKMHATTLHSIAVSLNEDRTLEEIMQTIVGQSKILIDAELSAISLYDEKGEFSRLKVYGLDEEEVLRAVRRMPKGEGILKLLKLSLAPVKINDVPNHPAFSGSFPAGHPAIRNFLGYPIFSKDGRPIAALYFANKRSGEFGPEDEEVLMAVASDAAVAIQRVSDTADTLRFKKIIESSFDAIIITDGEGCITYVNPAFESMTGFSACDVVGSNPRFLKSGMHDEAFYRTVWGRLRTGRPWQGEFVNKKKSGETYNASTVIFPVFSDSGEIANYVSIQRDVSEEKRLHGQLLRAQKMEAIGTLAGGIAHDFNNLLSAIIGYAEIMKEDLPEDHPNYRHVSIIEHSAKRGADLAARILNATKTEKVEHRVVNLNAVVQDTLELLSRSIPKSISMDTRLAPELRNIKASTSQLQQVIMNLAVNARDAMPEGGSLLIETVNVGQEDIPLTGRPSAEGFVRLGISDTGKGMEEAILHKVFDPFFTTKSRGSGTGLGLYIVHSIVTNHGGYINLLSEAGRGTRFHVYFPVCTEAAEVEAAPTQEDLTGDGTVLIIEDEADVRSLTSDILRRYGYSVLAAADGTEGVAAYRERQAEIDLVLLDMIMPMMNGTEVFQILRGINPQVKVILISGYSSEGLGGISRLLRSGAKRFIQKPFTQKLLGRAVKEAIAAP